MAKKKRNKKKSVAQRTNKVQSKLDELHQMKELLASEGIDADHQDRQREFILQSRLRQLKPKKIQRPAKRKPK